MFSRKHKDADIKYQSVKQIWDYVFKRVACIKTKSTAHFVELSTAILDDVMWPTKIMRNYW